MQKPSCLAFFARLSNFPFSAKILELFFKFIFNCFWNCLGPLEIFQKGKKEKRKMEKMNFSKELLTPLGALLVNFVSWNFFGFSLPPLESLKVFGSFAILS